MGIRLADKTGEEIPVVDGLVKATKDIDLKTDLLLAACLISMKGGSSLIKVLNLTYAPVTVYKNTKIGSYLENKQNIVVKATFTNQNQTKTLETIHLEKHVNKEGSKPNNQQIEEVQGLFRRHQNVSSRNSNGLGYCDKIEHKIENRKNAKPFRRSYCSMSFDKRKAIKNIEDLQDARLIEPTHLYWSASSILL